MTRDHESDSRKAPLRVAQYLRMSTENQQYSIDNQSDAISNYAREHHMDIVRTYSDAGKSGLTFAARPGLKQLIEDVERGSPSYSAILVYDVSRWGRFQDADESAYYEYRCRRSNIAIHYCAELFSNDGSLAAALLKTLKRTMAAEYSRELSAKVFAGKAKLIELGFRQGGMAGYGFRRLLVDQDGQPKFVLRHGEKKSIATGRVVLIPGPPEEIKVVHEIFRLYAIERRSTTAIADMLNYHNIPCEDGRRWTRSVIRYMVANPKYIGVNVTNRLSGKLHSRRVKNPPELWVRKDNAFPAIIAPELYKMAIAEAHARSPLQTDEELLDRLRQLLLKRGRLSERVLRASLEMPCSSVYVSRFGSLAEAYRRVGYKPHRNLEWVERDRGLVLIRREFIVRVVDTLKSFGASVEQDARKQFLTVNECLNMRLSIARCRAFKRMNSWKLSLVSPSTPDVTIFARLAPGNETILDYFIAPPPRKDIVQITISAQTPPTPDVEQFIDLAFLEDFAEWGRRRRKK